MALSGCTEKLDGSAGCPLACSGETVNLQTVTLDAVEIDTTVLGGLGKGTEPQMLLANRGDTLDTRVILRFDTLPSTSRATSSATPVPIAYLDSAVLTLQIDSAAANVKAPITISVYDVDDSTAVDDTSAAALAALFTPSRLIVARDYAGGEIVDSVKIQLPADFLLAKAQAGARLRLGLQVSSAAQSVEFRVFSRESGFPANLALRTSPDTAVQPILMGPYSTTPSNNLTIAQNLGDFSIVVRGTPPPPAGTLTVGGLPGRRTYMRFNIPPSITDSSLVIAATLLLTQRPSVSPDPTDSMLVQPLLVLAGPSVVDPSHAALITAPITVLALSPLRTAPADSGVKEVQIGPVFRYWAAQTVNELPRAIVLQSATEDYSAQQSLFYPSSAAPELRPKLRISYTPRTRVGVP
jgi:hypothetical protein